MWLPRCAGWRMGAWPSHQDPPLSFWEAKEGLGFHQNYRCIRLKSCRNIAQVDTQYDDLLALRVPYRSLCHQLRLFWHRRTSRGFRNLNSVGEIICAKSLFWQCKLRSSHPVSETWLWWNLKPILKPVFVSASFNL